MSPSPWSPSAQFVVSPTHPPIRSTTHEEFQAFHGTDRNLFALLASTLNRDPVQSIQVIAFWIWIGQKTSQHLVQKILKLTQPVIDTLYEETLLCLEAVKNNHFPYTEFDIPLLETICLDNCMASVKYFHDNRVRVMCEVGKIVQEVCLPAFEDLIEQTIDEDEMNRTFILGKTSMISTNPMFYSLVSASSNTLISRITQSVPTIISCITPGFYARNDDGNYKMVPGPISKPCYTFKLGDDNVPVLFGHPSLAIPKETSETSGQGGYDGSGSSGDEGGGLEAPPPTPRRVHGFDVYKFNAQCRVLLEQLMELLRDVSIDDDEGDEENEVVDQSERTIFLTFSKGYPVYETEITEFFTRVHGDVIEAIHMQEVAANKQALYAKLVVRNGFFIEKLLGGRRKIKFLINGKHVCARKFIPK